MDTKTAAPVEAKVKAATAGAAGGAAVLTPALVWVADQIWWNGDAAPDVPLPVVALLGVAATGVCTFVAGYKARHTPRRSA
jgi:hypothetical protein